MTTLEQQQKEARERFDKLDLGLWDGLNDDQETIKSFLDTEIAKAYLAGQESVLERVADVNLDGQHEEVLRYHYLIIRKIKSLSTEKLEVTNNHEK